MDKRDFRNLKPGDRVRHKLGGYVVTIEHENVDPLPMTGLPVFWADCLGSLAVVTRPDLWEVERQG